MTRLAAFLRENLRFVTAIAAGALVVLVIGLTTHSVTAISFAGLAVGVLVGILIAAESGRREAQERERRKQ